MKGNKFLLKVCAAVMAVPLVFCGNKVLANADDYNETVIEAMAENEEEATPEVEDIADTNEVSVSIDEVTSAPIMPTEWTTSSLENCKSQVWYRYKMDDTGYMRVALRAGEGTNSEKLKMGWSVKIYTGDDLQNPIQSKNNILMDAYTSDPIVVGTNEIYICICAYETADNCYAPVGQPFDVKILVEKGDTWEKEFNNILGDAMEIKADTTYYATLYKATDVDYYKFVMPDTGYYQFDFRNDPNLSNLDKLKEKWNYKILDADGNEIYTSGTTNAKTTHKMPCEKGTIFYIRVSGNNNDLYYVPAYQVYDIKVNFTKTNEYETEVNNSLDKADNISIGTPIKGITNRGKDVDWFKFDVPAKQKISLDFEVAKPAGANELSAYNITVCGVDGKTIKAFEGVCKNTIYKFGGEGTIVELQPGTNYIKIANVFSDNYYVGVGAEYTLKVNDEGLSGNTVSYNGLEGVIFDRSALVTNYEWSANMKPIKLLTKKALIKPGFTFKGWYDDKTGKKVTKITKKTENGASFTAKWVEHKYTIAYVVPKKVNGVKVVGKIAPIKNILYSQTEILSEGAGLSVQNAKLVGWTTQKGSNVVGYKPGQSISKLTEKNKKKVKLYAIFQ